MEMFQRYTRASSTANTSDGNDDVEIGSVGGLGHRRRNISDTEPLLGTNSNSSTTNIGSSPSSINFKDTTSSTIPLSSSLSMSNHGTTKDSNIMNGTSSSSTSAVANNNSNNTTPNNSTGISNMGYFVLILLAVQNCSKNLLMRYVMKDSPKFFTSTAVLCCECDLYCFGTKEIITFDPDVHGTGYDQYIIIGGTSDGI
jgi:hypothetical protein